MGKKNYTTEITDVFESKLDAKQALKLSKNIKSHQEKAFPSKKYKQSLFSRLETMHLIDQDEAIKPRFSIFQIFGAFASFVFIAGSSFMVFDIRENSQDTFYNENSLRESINPKVFDMPSVQSAEKVVDDSTAHQEDISPQAKMSEIETESIVNTQASSQVQAVQNPGFEKSSRLSDTVKDESFPDLSNSAASSMMMDELIERKPENISFIDICSEYNGEVSLDGAYCIFEQGIICEEYNIHECALQNSKNESVDIDLEELIEAHGQ